MRKDVSSVKKSITSGSYAPRRDRNAVAALHARYFSRIRHHIYSRIGSVTDAEDLAQDVFVELYKGNGCFRENEDLEKYLFGIVRNIIRGYYRKRARSVGIIPIEEIGTPTGNIDTQQQYDPVKLTEKQELIKVIEKAVTKLPPKARNALRLRFIDGLSIKQAAREVGCTPVIFSHRLSYAIKLLRKVLGSL